MTLRLYKVKKHHASIEGCRRSDCKDDSIICCRPIRHDESVHSGKRRSLVGLAGAVLTLVLLCACSEGGGAGGAELNPSEPAASAASPALDATPSSAGKATPSTSLDSASSAPPAGSALASPTPRPTLSASPKAQAAEYKATLAAVGDILIHNTVYQDASTSNGGFDFRPMFSLMAEDLRKPELLVANQESLAGGLKLGLSSYPLFNSPFEITDALQDAGVDLVTMANNHTLDKGERGVLSALQEYDRVGMPHTGAFSSGLDRAHIRVLESTEGIRFAFLAYTFGTNGIPVPADKPYLVSLLEETRVQQEVETAKRIADVVVVSPHWGVENMALPNSEQRNWARRLADWGADVVIGTHPHVLQPMEWLDRTDGRRTLVMYSLGNFLSAQDQMPQLVGGMASVEVVKRVSEEGVVTIRLEHPALLPTYNRYANWKNYRVVPFDRLEQADWSRVSPVWEPLKARLLKAMPELSIKDGGPGE